MKRALVIGCGGTVGGAWQVGALHAIRDALGWDPREADVLVGTSAGSHLSAMLGMGLSVDDLVAAQRDEPGSPDAARLFFTRPPSALPSLPAPRPTAAGLTRRAWRGGQRLVAAASLAPTGRTDPAFLDRLARDLTTGDWVTHPAVWLVAVNTRLAQRVAFGAPDAPAATLSEALRASWSVPGWYPPVTIGGDQHLDGGAWSPTSADLLADRELDEVVIISPMTSKPDDVRIPGLAGRVEGLLRARMNRTLDAEEALLRSRGIRVLRVHPGAQELALLGPNFMDPRRRLPALDAALTHLPARLKLQLAG
ncbi:patatin [Pseudonocardiaceae bacterium YIM PH 21723]|nr:patatin [Pseudonocardiaceae bacterium YIM PH 21723]